MADVSPVFEKTYHHYLSQITNIDLTEKSAVIGVRYDGNDLVVSVFNRQFRVTADGILDDAGQRPHFALCVLICRYLIHYQPGTDVSDRKAAWTSFKDFRDAAPLVNYFTVNAEKAVADYFAGRVYELSDACRNLGGKVPGDSLAYDLVMRITALPRVPLLFLFNDADNEFPAQCSILFERRAKYYLDMECLAIIGALLSDNLIQASKAI